MSPKTIFPGIAGTQLSEPLDIKVIVLDLDGTLVPTYKTLASVAATQDSLQRQFDAAGGETCMSGAAWQSHLMRTLGIQNILHRPEQVFREYMRSLDYGNPAISEELATLKDAKTSAHQSYELYSGAADFLRVASKAGVFGAIYTNSPDSHAVDRSKRAGLDPDHLSAFYAKKLCDEDSPSWKEGAASSNGGGFGRIVIPYTYQKPDPTPLHEIARLTGASPDQILVIGEGLSDLRVALGIDPSKSREYDPKSRNAIFCFQEHGANDISPAERDINNQLRPGKELLGAEAVNKEIDALGINDSIIRLPKGFETLLDLIDSGFIRLSSPAFVPVVKNNQLTAGDSDKPARSSPRASSHPMASSSPFHALPS
ncbi:MAG: HAD family hydrolase [Alphaproteobacteria bacterium]